MLMDILAGIVCGLFMGTVLLGGLAFVLYAGRDMYDRLAKILPTGISPTVVMLALLFALPTAWGIFGAIAGALYNLAVNESPEAGLGSPNSIFTLAILCIAALFMLPALFFMLKRKKWALLIVAIDLAFAGIFGWLLPLLANWR